MTSDLDGRNRLQESTTGFLSSEKSRLLTRKNKGFSSFNNKLEFYPGGDFGYFNYREL
jgi:hypothetical protein